MLFLTGDDTDIDTLNETLAREYNVCPQKFENNSLDDLLPSFFAAFSEMVKNTRSLSERDREIIGKFAG